MIIAQLQIYAGKRRIRKKIKKEPSLSSQLELIDSAYITTFDSYSLSVLKKYHYLLNLPKNIGITDSTLVQIKKEEILDNIFEELYEEKNEKFEEFISTFCIKDDKEIRNYLLNIYSKLELKTDKKEYLEKYINEYFNEEKIRNDIDLFEKSILKKKEKIEENVKKAFELSKARVEAESRYLRIKGKDIDNYQKMLSYIIFQNPATAVATTIATKVVTIQMARKPAGSSSVLWVNLINSPATTIKILSKIAQCFMFFKVFTEFVENTLFCPI